MEESDSNYEMRLTQAGEPPLNKHSVLLAPGHEATFMPTVEGIPAMGYLEAGHILCSYLLEESTRQDSLVHPILYCYRHYFELALKDQIALTLRRNGEDYDPVEHRHNLRKLFSDFRRLTEHVVVEEEGPEATAMYDLLQVYVEELHEFDERSTMFRYHIPHSKNQGYRKQINISLSTLQQRMDEIANWLSSLNTWWDENHPYLDEYGS